MAMAVATCAGVGRVPLAPGTAGSVLALPVYLVFYHQPLGLRVLSLLALVALAVWAADRAERLLGRRDPPSVVIDEVAGLLVALAWLAPSVTTLTCGFLLFRAFDILKVPPARWVERRLPGGLAVVMDDLVAGVYANVCLRLILWIAG